MEFLTTGSDSFLISNEEINSPCLHECVYRKNKANNGKKKTLLKISKKRFYFPFGIYSVPEFSEDTKKQDL